MAADPAHDENLLQLAVITPNPERRWVLVYDVVPLQSYDPTLEEEVQEEKKEMSKGGEEAEVHEAAVEKPEVVDQPKSPVAAPEREESAVNTEQSAAGTAE